MVVLPDDALVSRGGKRPDPDPDPVAAPPLPPIRKKRTRRGSGRKP
jgi:hypothetical protein